MDPDITQLAKMMRARRSAGMAPYTLLLGSSLSLTLAVRRAACDSEDWEVFWETVSCTSPEERRALMHKLLSQLDLDEGCDALAQLAGAGYFNVVLTLNVDDILDNAFKILPPREYRILVHGEVSSHEIVAALDRPTPRIKVVKLRGDVNAYKLPLTPEATFEFPHDLEEALTRLLRRDTVVVGDLLPFDDDVQRCIRGGDGALWVIAAEGSDVLSETKGLSKDGFLERAKRIRKVGKVITATEFNAFFTALAEALDLGGAEEVAPEVALFVPLEERGNPYRGLEPFEPEHAPFFFGRESLTKMLVELLRQERFLTVLGASGSGKSSVVRAGVLPALEQGKLPNSENWPVRVIKPGQNPQEALAGALADMVSIARSGRAIDYARLQETHQEIEERLFREESALHELVTEVVDRRRSPTEPDDHRVIVVIDQFEELFTLCPFEQRQRFIDTLLYAVRQPDGHTTVLLTLRADFVPQCTAYPDLSDLVSSHQVWVRAMNDESLRAAIERPAWKMGMRYEPGLVPLILADAGREPGALPLLEDALWSLFEYCREGDEVIELREYREIGGVQGALAKRADDVYATLSVEEQKYTRRILLRLVEVRESQEPMQWRATLDELIAASEERAPVVKVVQRLTDARLLTTTQEEETGQRVVEISHRALIQGWPRLRDWIDEDRAGLRTHHRLIEAAQEWERRGRDENDLYRGVRLAEAEEWAEAHADDLNPLEREFVQASIKLRDRHRVAGLTLGGAIGAGLGLGLLRAVIEALPPVGMVGIQFAMYFYWAAILGAALSFGMALAESLLLSRPEEASETPARWLAPLHPDRLPAVVAAVLGTLFFWIGHAVVTFFNSFPSPSNTMEPLRVLMVFVAGLGLSVALYGQPRISYPLGLVRSLLRPGTVLRLGTAALSFLLTEWVFIAKDRGPGLNIVWSKSAYKAKFYDYVVTQYPQLVDRVPRWSEYLALLDAALVGIVLTIGITAGLVLAADWLARWCILGDRTGD